MKAAHTGILRSFRQGWQSGSDWHGKKLCTSYSDISRYKSYMQKLDETIDDPLKNQFKDISLTIPVIGEKDHYLKHGDEKYVNNAIEKISKIYNQLIKNFNYKDIQNSQIKDVNNYIAQSRWIMVHSTPWERGSDSISNVFMRAMYKSLGIKSYPLKKGISLDMEAYCTNLSDYKKNFSSYFEKPPEIV